MSDTFTTDDGDFATESDVDHRVITHANGDRTVVDFSITEEKAAALSALSGDELAAAIQQHRDQADAEAAAKAQAEATQAVLNDPPVPAPTVAQTTSPLAPAPAGPDPVTQGGLDAPVPPFTSAPVPDAATVKVAEQAAPQVAAVPQDTTAPAATAPAATATQPVETVDGHPALSGDPSVPPTAL